MAHFGEREAFDVPTEKKETDSPTIGSPEIDESREAPGLPGFVVDFVRHGSTEYQEYWDAVETGRLDATLEDLTEKGKQEILKTAEDLALTIDKEQEIVIIASSPRARTLYSARLIADHLKAKGIEVVEDAFEAFKKEPTEKDPKSIEALRSNDFKDIPEGWPRAAEALRRAPGATRDRILELSGLTPENFEQSEEDVAKRFGSVIGFFAAVAEPVLASGEKCILF